MHTRRIGDVDVSAIGLGGMPMSIEGRPDEARSLATIHAALDAGVTLIDTADAYHRDAHEVGHNETLIAKALASHDRGIGPHIGSQLDQALNRVYAWCSDKNVPIVAHTNNTFGPSLDYANRADPHFWKRALQSYPKLRVNMAHFGHFNNAVMKDDVKAHVNECWEWVIGDIMHSQPDGYAYADISSIAEILKPGPSRKLFDCMVAFKASFPRSADKLIYGTDWSMIAQTEGFPRAFSNQPYTELMVKFLSLVGYTKGEIEGIMFRNAARYLGLSRSEQAAFGDNCSRGRLEKFYAVHGLPADWMHAFD